MTEQPSPVTQTKGVYITRVLVNETICREHGRLILEVEDFPDASPGQFVQMLCSDIGEQGWIGGAFIRRPFSIGGLHRNGRLSEMVILYRVVGPGTQWLARLQPDEHVSILGPVGRPFEVLADKPVAYLVGGGVGLPPLIWLAKTLRLAGRQVVAFCGARNADLLPLQVRPGFKLTGEAPTLAVEEFAQWGTTAFVSTDDGSIGLTGQIPEIFDHYVRCCADEAERTVVYTCGPEPMMRAVVRICRERSLPCQVCLERMMACGMGTCQSCVVRIRDHADPQGWRYQLCCKDGPVFDSQTVIWED